MLRLQGHKQRIVVQPGGLLLAKDRKILAIRRAGAGLKASRRPTQLVHAKGNHGLEVNRLILQPCVGWQPVVIQPALLLQVGQVNQQRVAGKGRTAHVGRIAQTDTTQRQHLPEALPAGHQPVDKMVGRWPKVAAAVRPR